MGRRRGGRPINGWVILDKPLGLTSSRKTYRFRLRWGEARTTDDAEGAVVATSAARPDAATIAAALPRFTGTVLQAPPAYSAIKVAGRRAYALAREGADVRPLPRPVEIVALRLVGQPDADHAEFEMVSGKLDHSAAAFGHLLPIETALDDIPALALTEAEARRLRHGQSVVPLHAADRARIDQLGTGAMVRATTGRTLVALAEIVAGGLRPVRVINP